MKKILSKILICSCLAGLYSFSPDEGKTVIYMMGDSTMADKSLEKQNPERGWGQYLPSLLDERVIVRNYARNGRSSKSFITEGLWDKVESSLKPGDYVFIQFGHNDQKEDTARYTAPFGEYSENLRMFAQAALSKGAVPVLFSSIARRHFTADGTLEDTHGDYPAAAKAVAEEFGLTYIDMTSLTGEWLTKLGDTASGSYFMHVEKGTNPLHPDGLTDNTHLNVKGARAVAQIAVGQLKEHIPELSSHFRQYDFVVAQDGSGDFFTVQEAINACPFYNKNRPTTIYIKNGTYKEKITIPADKNRLHLIGQDVEKTILTYDDYAQKTGPTGFEVGTSGSGSIFIHADDFTADNITFENSAGEVGQAVAAATRGDRMRFRNCRFLGNQDTLYTLAPGSRQYYYNCYIEGTTDFIFGFSIAYFKDCEIHSKRNSFITAASTPEGQTYGYVFDGCRLTAAGGVDKVYLGRPWRNYAQTVFIRCEMGSHIQPAGWQNWNKPEAEKTTFYAEYGNTGPGAHTAQRVKWSHQLTKKQAALYTPEQVLAGNDQWDPEQE